MSDGAGDAPIGRLVTATTPALPRLDAARRADWLTEPRTRGVHDAALAEIGCFQAVESAGDARRAQLPAQVAVAAWNLERAFDPDGAVDALRDAFGGPPALALLSEMDCGMARTGQRHTAADMAAQLGLACVYGVEFLELGLGSERERSFATEAENAAGFHGNALLSAAAPSAVWLLRFQEDGLWWTETDRGEPRLGARMALIAALPWEGPGGEVLAVSTHFESHAPAPVRTAQMTALLTALETIAAARPGGAATPVVIGGDLNTGVRHPERDWRTEPLFDLAREAGFTWEGGGDGPTTRASRLTTPSGPPGKLDWLAVRGLRVESAAILPALDAEGAPLSDHEAVTATLAPA